MRTRRGRVGLLGAASGALVVALWAVGVVGVACARAEEGGAMKCDVTVETAEALAAALDEGGAGAVVCVAPGEYRGSFVVRRSVTVVGVEGAAKTRLDGEGAGAVVTVAGAGLEVALRGLTLRGGRDELGGGLRLAHESRVRVVDAVIEDNAAVRGGGVFADAGQVSLERAVVRRNKATHGGGVAVDGTARVELLTSVVAENRASQGAGVSVGDGASVALTFVTCFGQEGDGLDLRVRGTMSRAPEVTAEGVVFAGGVDARPPGALAVTRSAFGPDAAGFGEEGGNASGELALDGEGKPGAGSVARGLAVGAGADLGGRSRPERAAAGAWEPVDVR